MKKYILDFQHIITLLYFLLFYNIVDSQIVINEGSNKNYTTIMDEDGEYPDWIEIYNPTADSVSLLNYSLSNDLADPVKWTFPNIKIAPGEFKTIFCSGKNRKPISGFLNVANTGIYNPIVGWNTHTFSTPFYWDGISNVLINTCAYSSTGYTSNSVFNQSATTFNSTISAYQDGNASFCGTLTSGGRVAKRPNMQLNGIIIGSGAIQNGPFDYPAPYGNWYWGNKTQMLIQSSELLAAGLTAGYISSLAFDVVSTDPATNYDYIDIHIKLVDYAQVSNTFEPVNPSNFLHTNFTFSSSGGNVYLYAPSSTLINSLFVSCLDVDASVGSFPDSSASISIFQPPTPSASNNSSVSYSSYLLEPTFSIASGIYSSTLNVNIVNPNPVSVSSSIYYTNDGSDPTTSSILYDGTAISVYFSQAIKAKAFAPGIFPSTIAVETYLLGINHETPVLSIVTDNVNLYGATGIFDNWWFDWQKAAYVEYFDTAHQLIFSQNSGLMIDGGAGGSRSQPQHSMKVELNHPVLGEGAVNYAIIPNRPNRSKFNKFYLRNGSNMYLGFPHKDACQVELMGGESNVYYSAWRPISVYINGSYFGLYELREKFDIDYFVQNDNANADSTDILSLSYWGGGMLRSITGISIDSFFVDYDAFTALDPTSTNYWKSADEYFDLKYYTDYIISESWMANHDWPYNNIKIYRSDATNYRWRFGTLDLESGLNPGGWVNYEDDHIGFMKGQCGYPYLNIWCHSMENSKYKNYFINRYADLMNTSYHMNRVLPIENDFFQQTVIEMPKEYARWGNPSDIAGQMNQFSNNHLLFKSELMQRSDVVRGNIVSNFSLVGEVEVTLNVFPEGAGRLKISTIVPDSLPWTGVYFNGNPVEIVAIANPGFNFSHWDSNSVLLSEDINDTININITSSDLFNAVFTINPFVGKLAMSEVNYHSNIAWNSGDWVEFHNYGNGVLDVSGWTFIDSTIFNTYTFPMGSVLQPDDYLILCSDSLLFHSQNPGVPVYGQFPFNLSNSNEALTVMNYFNEPVLSMHYYDSSPWPLLPISPDGEGSTLELLADSLDPSLSSNWFIGCIAGSPGGPYTTPCLILESNSIDNASFEMSIYPNPSEGIFTVKLPESVVEDFEFEIINMIGEKVPYEVKYLGDNLAQIDLLNSQEGVYFVKMSTKEKMGMQKLIVNYR